MAKLLHIVMLGGFQGVVRVMWVWRETREKWLLAAALAVLGLIILINLKLDVWPWLKGGKTAAFLTAEATGSVTSDLLVGLFSAYAFYVAIELVPRHRKEQTTLKPLNLLAASIIDAYERTKIFGHETPITSIGLDVLSIDNLMTKKAELEANNQLLTLKLKFAMETAHSRYPDFQHSLVLAASISPEHALDWLVITDRVRLLAENYLQWPTAPYDDMSFWDLTDKQKNDPIHIEKMANYEHELKNFCDDLRVRVIDVVEAAALWMKRQSS